MGILPKKFVIVFFVLFAIVGATVTSDIIKAARPSQEQRSVKYWDIDFYDSWHDEEYVYFKNSVSWGNETDDEFWGNIYAIIPNGTEEKLYAYDTDTGEKKIIHIKPHTNVDVVLIFRGIWQGEYSKASRTEPVDIVFEVIDLQDDN